MRSRNIHPFCLLMSITLSSFSTNLPAARTTTSGRTTSSFFMMGLCSSMPIATWSVMLIINLIRKQCVSHTSNIFIIQMLQKISLLLLVTTLVDFADAVVNVSSFEDLAKHHCEKIDIELLWRIATGSLSEKYGESFFDYDCYIRQFVKKDGMTIFQSFQSDSEEEQQQYEEEDTELQVDPLVNEYSVGLQQCLPQLVDPTQAVYAIWRFIRFTIQNDYAYEWLRAKIRSGMGYEAERPSAWMDGETKSERLRLDKLFSNQFYEYVDKLMFKDFLHPILTFLKKNTVLALSGDITESGHPILVQQIEAKSYLKQFLFPVIFNAGAKPIFCYSVPGIPLLLAGSSSELSWAFTGVLVDRSNIEQIETINNKFYNFNTEEWQRLTVENLTIPGIADKQCQFIHSHSGTLFTKHDREGKTSEYISKWHEDEKAARMLFSGLYNLVLQNGLLAESRSLEFPFNSIVLVNRTGIFQYLCQQRYPSYFLYPDMFGEPEKLPDRWISYSKKYVAVSNTQLTTMKQESYRRGEINSPIEEHIAIAMKARVPSKNKFTVRSAMQFVSDLQIKNYVKKQKEYMVSIYRKVKFIYMPEEGIRKKCDQMVAMLEKWDNSLTHPNLAPIFILWQYFVRDYTFNYVSGSPYGLDITRHKAVSELYWTNQMALWQKGTSYGECVSNQYEQEKMKFNGTGQNSTCYFNIMRAINRTQQILFEKYDEDLKRVDLSDFTGKQTKNLTQGYMGSKIQEAFNVFFEKHVFFAAEILSSKISYIPPFSQQVIEVSLNSSAEPEQILDTDL